MPQPTALFSLRLLLPRLWKPELCPRNNRAAV
jgi:hypothetical protein